MTANRAARRRGFSLIEVMTVCIIMGVLASMSVTRFSRAMEQSRANIAVANLRAIWTAQRAFWLQNNYTFAADLEALRTANLLDQAIIDDPGTSGDVDPGISYVYQITLTPDGPTPFQAGARRVNSTVWVSTLLIDANGYVSGTVQYVGSSADNANSRPIDQFFQ